jgi:hypothetical protein
VTFVPFGAIIPEAGGGGFKVGQRSRDEGDASDDKAKT